MLKSLLNIPEHVTSNSEMTTKRNSYSLKNDTGIKFHLSAALIIQIFAFFILFKSGHYPFWMLGISGCLILFGIRRVKLDVDQIIIYYPLIPFYNRKIPVSFIKKLTFSLKEGSLVYPQMTLIYSKFPFFTQIRIGLKDDIEEILKILTIHGKFKIKPLSDKRVMKKRLEKILSESECFEG